MVITKIKNFITGNKPAEVSPEPESQTVLIDTRSLTRHGKNLNPRTKFDLLRQLSLTSQHEKFAIRVFFEGEPLRAVEEGKKFDEIMPVHYADTETELRRRIEKMAKDLRGNIRVVTSDPEIERSMLSAGIAIMQGSSFSRAFGLERGMGGGGGRERSDRGERGERPERGERGERRERSDSAGEGDATARKRRRRPGGRRPPGQGQEEENTSSAPKTGKSNNPVSDLIDLV